MLIPIEILWILFLLLAQPQLLWSMGSRLQQPQQQHQQQWSSRVVSTKSGSVRGLLFQKAGYEPVEDLIRSTIPPFRKVKFQIDKKMAKKRNNVSKVRGAAEGKTLLDMGFTLTVGTTPTTETSHFKDSNSEDKSSRQKDPANGVKRRSSSQKEPSKSNANRCANMEVMAATLTEERKEKLPQISKRYKDREKINARKRLAYQAMTIEERNKKRKLRFKNMTEEEREKKREKERVYRRQRYKMCSKETKEKRNASNRKRIQAKTPEERKAYYKKGRVNKEKLTEEKLKKLRIKERQRNKRYYDKMSSSKKEKFKIAKSNRMRQPATCPYCRKTITSYCLNKHVEIHRKCARFHATLNQEQRSEIEVMSRGGAGSEGGKKVRQYRVTGTRAHDVFRWTINRKDLGQLARNYSQPSTDKGFRKTQPMKDGQELEIDAINAYQNVLGIPDANIQKRVGLLVHPQLSYLGATPDATFTTYDGLKGSIEVKYIVAGISTAKYLLKNKSRIWTTGKSGDYLTPVPGGSRETQQLNRNHTYFTQVVMQIMCGQMDFCDFIVYTKNKKKPKQLDMWRETISREEAEKKWQEMEPVLTSFFNTYLGPPALYTGGPTRSVADF